MQRDEMLGRVRAALGGPSDRNARLADWTWPREEIPDLLARFQAELVAVHGEWVDDAVEVTRALDVDGCMVGPGAEAFAAQVGLGIRPTHTGLGIVVADHAVAETGSVVFDRDGSHRAQLHPEVVLVLLDPDRLVGRLEELPPPEDGHRHRVVVTGPSRTADIEKRLVLGAHGPRRWIVTAH